MTKEKEESGTIKTATYIAYVKAAGGWVLFLLCCTAAVFCLFFALDRRVVFAKILIV